MGIQVSGGGRRPPLATTIAHERLEVAMRHYRTLERGWQAWLKQYPIRIEMKTSQLLGTVEAIARFSSAIDRDLASNAKACLGEVRAALDNTVVALVAEVGGKPDVAAFPITSKPEGWGRAARSRMPGLSEETHARARALQPWAMESPRATEHPLVFLGHWDMDKHREPLRVAVGTNFPNGSSRVWDISMTFEGPGARDSARLAVERLDADRVFDLTVGVIGDGQVLSRVKIPKGASMGHGHIDGAFCLVAIADGETKPDPLFPQLMNLMRFAGQAADYVTGVRTDVPKAWEPGEGIGGLPGSSA